MRVSLRFRLFFTLVIFANILVWAYARPLQLEWRNVPPAPSQFSAHAMGLGDTDLAYRLIGFMLQNIGKTGGRTESLGSYNYVELRNWFFQAFYLSPRANYVPMLATYYYGAVENPDDLREVIEFLRVAGNDPQKGRWRWLVHAIYLARDKLNDLDLALQLAEILKNLDSPHMPFWTKEMAAMVKNSRGEKEDAYILMKTLLETSAQDMHPAEVQQLLGYLCEQILTPEEAKKDPICDLLKP